MNDVARLAPRSFALAIIATVLAASFGLVTSPAPSTAQGLTCLVDRADTTYRLAPKDGAVRVRVDMEYANNCSRYYFESATFGWVPDSARRVRISGPGVSATVGRSEGRWRSYKLRYPDLLPGRSLRYRVTYELPTGHARSWNQVILNDEYWHLCWTGHGARTGTTEVIFPSRRKPETYVGNVSTKRRSGNVVVSAKRTKMPSTLFNCTDVFDVEQQIRSRVQSEGGGSVLIRGWAGDPSWSTRVRESTEAVLPRLEEIFGSPISPKRDIGIRQVADKSLRGYGGSHYTGGYIRLPATVDADTIAHELAHEWSNGRSFAHDWLQEGIAEWAATKAARTGSCLYPGQFPGKGAPHLARWVFLKPRPTEQQELMVDYQYDAACYVMTRLATRFGDERMYEVIQTLLDGRSPYGGTDRTRGKKGKAADWREWLDAVDEIGIAATGPEDLELAERLVFDYGIAPEKALRGRRNARSRYHELLSVSGGLQAPLVVRDLMDAWRFRDAQVATGLAEDILPRVLDLMYCQDELDGAIDSEAAATLLGRYGGARSIRALRRLRADVRDLRVPAKSCRSPVVPDPPPPNRSQPQ